MEMDLVKTEKTCLLCKSFPSCLVFLKMGRALETFDGPKIKALYYTLSEVCDSLGNYQEDPYVKNRVIEYGMLRRIVEALEENKIISIGRIREDGTGSRIASVFLQSIYNTQEEAEIFTAGMDVSLIKAASRQPSLASIPDPKE